MLTRHKETIYRVTFHVIVFDAVISRITDNSSEIVCPSEIVNTVSFVLEGASCNFCIQVVADLTREALMI